MGRAQLIIRFQLAVPKGQVGILMLLNASAMEGAGATQEAEHLKLVLARNGVDGVWLRALNHAHILPHALPPGLPFKARDHFILLGHRVWSVVTDDQLHLVSGRTKEVTQLQEESSAAAAS